MFDMAFYKPRPGHPDINECLKEAQALADEIRPMIVKDRDLTFSDRMRDMRRKTRAVSRVVKNYVINRRRLRAGNHALRPLYVIWTMLNNCNFRCGYCDNHQGKHYYDIEDPDRLNTEQGKKLLDVMFTGTPAIYWCGGEPILRNDLPELLDYAWNLGYFPNMINTNGSILHTRLKDPAWRNFLRQMDIIIVSLDALHLPTLNSLWGIETARQVLVNILLLRELKKDVTFKLAVNTVITPQTIEEAHAVLDLVCDLGLWFVPVPVNFKHRPEEALLTDNRYRRLVETILDRKRKGYKIIGSETLLRRLLYAEPYQCYTALKPHVWSNGHLCWPCRASANVAPKDINLLAHRSFDDAYEEGRRHINPDFFHGPGPAQCGGDCAWMQNYTTARYLDGLTHPLTTGFLEELSEFALNRKNW